MIGKVSLRFVEIRSGGMFVTMDLVLKKLLLLAFNLDYLQKVCRLFCVIPMPGVNMCAEFTEK